MGGGHPGRAPRPRPIRQAVEPVGEEGFEILARGLLMVAEMAGNPRHAPAGIGEAEHLQTIPGARGQPRLPGPGAQLVPLRRAQVNPKHGRDLPALHSTCTSYFDRSA